MVRLRSDSIASGLLLSPDGRHAAIYAPIEGNTSRSDVVNQLRKWIASRPNDGFDLSLTGPAVAEVTLGESVVRDIIAFAPLIATLLGALIFAMLRTLGSVIVALATTLLVAVWTFGLMGSLNIPITIISAAIPIVLLSVVIVDQIHFLKRLQRNLAGSANDNAALLRATAEAQEQLRAPVIVTSLTTAFAFFSFASESLRPLRDFGVCCGIAVLLALLVSFTVLPALVIVLPARAFIRPEGRARDDDSKTALERFACRNGRWSIAIAGALLIIALPGIGRLRVQDSWIANFSQSAPVVVADATFNRSFWGGFRLDVSLTSSRPSFFMQQRGIALAENVERAALTWPHVGGSMSYLIPFRTLAGTVTGKQILGSLDDRQLQTVAALADAIRDAIDLPQFITRDGRSIRLRFFVRNADYRITHDLTQRATALVADLKRQDGVDGTVAGEVAVSSAVVDSIVRGQLSSIAWSFAAIFLLLIAALRDPVLSLIATAPVAIAAMIVFGAMGFLGVNLGVASSMFAALTAGSGVDFAVHFCYVYRKERRAGADHRATLDQMFKTTGGAVRANTAVLSIALLALLASALRPLRVLGLLTSLSLVVVYLLTVLILPPLFEAWGRSLRVTAQ
jgi:predicted RND superfamily exporter protein